MNERIAEARREREQITSFAHKFLKYITEGVGPNCACRCVGVSEKVIRRYVNRVQRDIRNNTNESSQEERDFFYAFREAIRVGYAGLQARLKKKPTTRKYSRMIDGVERKWTATRDHAELAQSRLDSYPWEDLMEWVGELVGDEQNPEPDQAYFGIPIVSTGRPGESLQAEEEDPFDNMDTESLKRILITWTLSR